MIPRREEAVRLRAQGMSLTKIGLEMGISRQRVGQLLAPAERAHEPTVRQVMPAPAPKAPDELTLQIIRLYEEGLTDADIARTLGISEGVAGDRRRRAGVKGRPTTPRLVPCDVERLLTMARAGAAYADLGAEFGLSPLYVTVLLRKHGFRRHARSAPAASSDDILRLHNEGRKAADIADALKIPRARVYRALHRKGVMPIPSGSFMTKDDLPIVVEMLLAGETRATIAETAGVSLYHVGMTAYRLRRRALREKMAALQVGNARRAHHVNRHTERRPVCYRADVLRLHGEGKSASATAETLGIRRELVYGILSREGVTLNPCRPILPDDDLAVVVTMLRAGTDPKTIAKEVGVPVYRVTKAAYMLRCLAVQKATP